MIATLTNKFVDSLPPSSKATEFYWDKNLKGFGVKVQRNGRKCYVYQRGLRNKTDNLFKSYRIHLGDHGEIDCKTARELAQQKAVAFVTNLNNQDLQYLPLRELRKKKVFTKVDVQSEFTFCPDFKEVCDHFLEIKSQEVTLATLQSYKSVMNRYLIPQFKGLPLSKITRKQLLEMRMKMKSIPGQFNHCLSVMRGLFKFGIELEYIKTNAATDVPKYADNIKDYSLSKIDVKRIWDFLVTRDEPESRVLQMVILTGMRVNEITASKWSQVSMEEGTWSFYPSESKTKRASVITISEPMERILYEQRRAYRQCFSETPNMREADCPYIFFKPRQAVKRGQKKYIFKERKPLLDLQDFKFKLTAPMVLFYFKKVLDRLNIYTDYTTHDLRHAFASILANTGVPMAYIQKALGHQDGRTTEKYYTHFNNNEIADLAREAFSKILLERR